MSINLKFIAETEAQSNFGVDSARKSIKTAYKQLSGRFDKENGGFSSAPKFPRVSEINLVLLQHLISASHKQDSNAGKKTYNTLSLFGISLHTLATPLRPFDSPNHIHAWTSRVPAFCNTIFSDVFYAILTVSLNTCRKCTAHGNFDTQKDGCWRDL